LPVRLSLGVRLCGFTKATSTRNLNIYLFLDRLYVSSLPEDVRKFGEWASCRWSDAWVPDEILSLQVAPYATEQVCAQRPMLYGRELQELTHIAAILRGDYDFTADSIKFEGLYNGYDKTLMARYAEAGLVKIEDGVKISMLIPCLKKDEYEKLDKILLKIENDLGDSFFVDYIE